MKLTKGQLRRIIKEEKQQLLREMSSEQLALVEFDYDSVVAVPAEWLSPDIGSDDVVEMVSPREAETRGALVVHPGSHSVATIEDLYVVINELHSMWDLGYLNDKADWVSIFR